MSPVTLSRGQSMSNEQHANPSLQTMLSQRQSHLNIVPSNAFIQQRTGSILSRAMILKSDYIPTAQVAKLDINISGAPNFRQIRPYPIYACGQPSATGVRTILNMLAGNQQHKQKTASKTIWINLREEPIIYLNNRPFVLRELDTPFHNLIDFQGINYERLNQIEQRLKRDIIDEAEQNNGNILVHEEVNENDITALWESAHDVKTSKQVVEQLNSEGYDAQWWRVPITAESVFEPTQFDALIRAYVNAMIASHGNLQVIINCQFGRGRSTMGVLAIYLLHAHITGTQIQPQQYKPAISDGDNNDSLAAYRAGNWNAIVRLVRMLSNGRAAKNIVDNAVDTCGRIHNIRDAIVDSFLKAERARVADTHQVHSTYMTAHLKRYFYLICFQQYLMTLPTDLTNAVLSAKNHTFAQWLAHRPELVKLTDTLLIEDVESELMATQSKASTPTGTGQAQAQQLTPEETYVLKRHGAVLGKSIIVKSEYFVPKSLTQQLEALSVTTRLPNFRRLHNIPLGATAQPTVDGIRAILNALVHERRNLDKVSHHGDECHVPPLNQQLSQTDTTTTTTDAKPHRTNCHVMWINLREEPVIFINGQPYLLRESSHPFRSLPEFTSGITAERCEMIEKGFCADVLRELDNSGDSRQVLIHIESTLRTIIPKFEHVNTNDDVKTSKQIFEQLVGEQYDVQYCRIPLHVDQTPGLRSFDTLYDLLSSRQLIDEHINVVFQDQKGGRRSTLGMVVALLMMVSQESIDFTIVQQDGNTIHQMHATHAHAGDTQYDHERVVNQSQSMPTHIRVTVSSHDQHTQDVSSATHMLPLTMPITQRMRQVSVAREEDDDDTGETLDEVQPHYNNPANYKSILQLTRVIKRGKQVKDEVDMAIDVCGSAFHLRDAIAEAKQRAEQDRSNNVTKQRLATAIKLLESYAYLIAFNAYLHERHDFEYDMQKYKQTGEPNSASSLVSPMKPSSSNRFIETLANASSDDTANDYTYPSFSAWISSRPELRLAIENIRRQPDDALKIVVLSLDSRFGVTDELRSGNVLVRGSILKSDYFIGCVNKNIEQIVDGAINFRPITNFPVAGTGIPTSDGIVRVLEFFGLTDPPELLSTTYKPLFIAESCVWFNLREEPLLYVNNRPFVLRDSDVPYTNIEHTGITARRLEAMEKQLKLDAQIEAAKCGNKLLLHDEDELGNLIVHWEPINDDSIRTPREQFIDSMKHACEVIHQHPNSNKQFKVQYYRTPITDEQAPSPAMLDDLMKYLQTVSQAERRQLVFNCQMGRGRTTTGLIVGCMWCLFKGETSMDALGHNNNDTSASRSQSSAITRRTDSKSAEELSDLQYMHNQYPTSRANETQEDTAKRRQQHHDKKLSKGWYRLIQSLARVLPDGPNLKHKVDAVIDHCAAFQNLRSVIYQTQQAALEALPRKQHAFVHRGTNYLIRYFYLIVIGAYMQHIFTQTDAVKSATLPTSFREWLARRPEITNLLETSVIFPELDTLSLQAPNSPLVNRATYNRQTLSSATQLFKNAAPSVAEVPAIPPP